MSIITYEYSITKGLSTGEINQVIPRDLKVSTYSAEVKTTIRFCSTHRDEILNIAGTVSKLVPTNITDIHKIYEKLFDKLSEKVTSTSNDRFVSIAKAYENTGITQETQRASGSTITIDNNKLPKRLSLLSAIEYHSNLLLQVKCWTNLYLRLMSDDLIITSDITLAKLHQMIPVILLRLLYIGKSAVIRMPLEMYMISSIVQSAISIISAQGLILITTVNDVIEKSIITGRIQMIKASLQCDLPSYISLSLANSRIVSLLQNRLIQILEVDTHGLDGVIIKKIGSDDIATGEPISKYLDRTSPQKNAMIASIIAEAPKLDKEKSESRGRSQIRGKPRILSTSRTRSTSSSVAEYMIDKLLLSDKHSYQSKEVSRLRSQSPGAKVGSQYTYNLATGESRPPSRPLSETQSSPRRASNTHRLGSESRRSRSVDLWRTRQDHDARDIEYFRSFTGDIRQEQIELYNTFRNDRELPIINDFDKELYEL